MKTTNNPHVSKQANGDESVKKIIEINFWLTTLSFRKHLLRQKALYLYFVFTIFIIVYLNILGELITRLNFTRTFSRSKVSLKFGSRSNVFFGTRSKVLIIFDSFWH